MNALLNKLLATKSVNIEIAHRYYHDNIFTDNNDVAQEDIYTIQELLDSEYITEEIVEDLLDTDITETTHYNINSQMICADYNYL